MHFRSVASRFLVMATSKRERQRERRQAANRQQSVLASRGRMRSRVLKLLLLAAVIVIAVLILWLVLRDGEDNSNGNEADGSTQTVDGDSQDVTDGEVLDFPALPEVFDPGGELFGDTTSCPDPEGPELRITTFAAGPSDCLDSAFNYQALFTTTLGEIRVDLDQAENAAAVNAFVVLAGYNYYDGTAIFYTDPEGGYIQGGSPKTNTADDPGPGEGFVLDVGEVQSFGAGELLWAANSPSTGQFVFTNTDDFLPSQDIAGLVPIGSVDGIGLGVIAEILASHVDNPATAFGGRPAPAVIVESVEIIAIDPTLEGSIDLTNCPPADGSGPTVLDFDGPQPMCLDATKQYTAVFDTTAGEMRVALDMVNTPNTANNFAVLARYHYYDNTSLFRTDPSIGIIQGGAPHTNSPSDPGPGYTIPDEGSGFSYEPGQIVMARTGAPNSASAQFFFAVNENTALLNSQGTYVVFGQMDDPSLAVAEGILASHVDQPNNPLGGGPDPQVIVNSVTIEETG